MGAGALRGQKALHTQKAGRCHSSGPAWLPGSGATSSSSLGRMPWQHGENKAFCWGHTASGRAPSRAQGRSPAAPGGTRRPGARGSACAPRARPLTGWCTCPALAPTPRVWPAGLPGLLCTRSGQPSERTAGSTAGDCNRARSVTGTLPLARRSGYDTLGRSI